MEGTYKDATGQIGGYDHRAQGGPEEVVTDISRLVEQITDLERVETEYCEDNAKMEWN